MSPFFFLELVSLTWMMLAAYAMPTTVETMNYNALILVGIVFVTAVWWFGHGTRHYPGPKVMTMYMHDDSIESADGLAGTSPQVPRSENKAL